LKERDKYRADVFKNIGCGLLVGSLVPLLISKFTFTTCSVIKLFYGVGLGFLCIKRGLDIVIASEEMEDYNSSREERE